MGLHRLVRRPEKSERTTVYLAIHIHHIENLKQKKSQELFGMLLRYATQDKYRVTVGWHKLATWSPGTARAQY